MIVQIKFSDFHSQEAKQIEYQINALLSSRIDSVFKEFLIARYSDEDIYFDGEKIFVEEHADGIIIDSDAILDFAERNSISDLPDEHIIMAFKDHINNNISIENLKLKTEDYQIVYP